jgi:nickel-dependent lactate racemase
VRIDFPYPGYQDIAPVEVPDDRLMGVFAPRAFGHVNEKEVLARGFANPIGAPRLRDAVKGSDRVLIIIDDATRMTPTERILPLVFEELHAAGVGDSRIEFIQGVGTHRPMRPEELARKLGRYNGKYKVHEHHYLDYKSLHDFGVTRDGTRVEANKLVLDFDFVMGLGSIVPHRVKGLSGGAKIMFPGISGKEMMERNQWEASMQMSETVMGVAENSMRLRMEEAARIAGLKYIVNVVYDVTHKIVGCFTGDIVAAHREGALCSREVYAAHMPTRCDILIIDSHSADRDFWQSAKGAYAGTMAVRTDGSLILVSPNPEGVASNHKNLLEIGYRPQAQVVKLVQEGKVDDLVGAAILSDVCQIVDKTDCIMVSPGITPDDAKKIGFRHAATAQEALRMATETQGADASIAVVRFGGHVLPVVDDEESDRVADMTQSSRGSARTPGKHATKQSKRARPAAARVQRAAGKSRGAPKES